jgi:imidazoleglycerol phosphate synthase glutamine amidotransferase subunit HisH
MTPYHFEPLYSPNENADKQGRWARVVFYKKVVIAYITRPEQLHTYFVHSYFPILETSHPLHTKSFADYKDAQEWIITEFEKFKTKII